VLWLPAPFVMFNKFVEQHLSMRLRKTFEVLFNNDWFVSLFIFVC